MEIPLPPIPLPPHLVAKAEEYADGRAVAVEPRDAATVVLLRAAVSDGTPEVYLLRRQVSMAFAGGFCVFPGGGVDKRDFSPDVAFAGPSPSSWAARLGCSEDLAQALVCAAVRETFEESGVLLAGASASSVVSDTTGADWEADRVALESRELSMTEFLTRRGLVLRTDLLGVWAAWLTPVFEPKRYRTWFFTALLPSGQVTRDVSTESSSVTWASAAGVVSRVEAGEVMMLPPTYLTCLEVGQHPTLASVMATAADREVEMFTPGVEPLGDGHTLSMPDHLRPLVAARRG